MAAEMGVRDDLAVALEMMTAAISPNVYRKAAADLGRMEQAETAFKYTRAALDRHRREPERPNDYDVGYEDGYQAGAEAQREPAGRGTA